MFDALLTDEEIHKAIGWKYYKLDDYGLNLYSKVAKAQHLATLKAVVEWGNEWCNEHRTIIDGKVIPMHRHGCQVCWQALKKSMEE